MVLTILIAIVVFTLVGMAYWRMIRILSALIQVLAYAAGIGVTVALEESQGLVTGLLVGSAVYLMFFSMVIIVRRLGNLEAEVVKLGGNPNRPMLLGFLFKRFKKNSAEQVTA